jgi:hypothetical protein
MALDRAKQRGAELLQVGFDIGEDVAPLRGPLSCGATTLFERLVVLSGAMLPARKTNLFEEDESF